MSMEDDKREPEGEERPQAERPWWAEAMRDLTSSGLATLFMTEESLRNYLKERKFPKELVSVWIDTMSRRKDDVYKVIGKEVGAFLSKVDLSREISRFLEGHRVNFTASFSFEPKKEKDKEST